MTTATSFFATGWEHIVDINAYDHLLFVTTLCAAYQLVQWRQILVKPRHLFRRHFGLRRDYQRPQA